MIGALNVRVYALGWLCLGRVENGCLDEYFKVEGCSTFFESIGKMRALLNDYLKVYSTRRLHQGRDMGARRLVRDFAEGIRQTMKTEVTNQTKTAKHKAT